MFCKRVCRFIQVDQMVTAWEQKVEENKKLLPSQRIPIPARSDDLVPKRWKAAALGALQEAAESYLIGNFHNCFNQILASSNFTISVNARQLFFKNL